MTATPKKKKTPERPSYKTMWEDMREAVTKAKEQHARELAEKATENASLKREVERLEQVVELRKTLNEAEDEDAQDVAVLEKKVAGLMRDKARLEGYVNRMRDERGDWPEAQWREPRQRGPHADLASPPYMRSEASMEYFGERAREPRWWED